MSRSLLSQKSIIQLYIQPQLATSVSLRQWESLILVMRSEQLLARFGYRFREVGVLATLEKCVQRHFENAITLAEHQHTQIRYEAKKLSSYLKGKTKKLVFLKGGAYVLSNCSASIGRTCGDVDVIVEKSDITAVEKALILAGWCHKDINDYDDQYYRKWAHEIPPLTHGVRGTVLDLHHNLVPIISGRMVDTEILFRYTKTHSHGIETLTEPAMFVHSSIHLFFNEDFKYAYRDIFDLYLMSKGKSSAFWIEVINISKALNFKSEVDKAIRYLSLCFELKLPPETISLFDKKLFVFELSFKDKVFISGLSPKHYLSTDFFGTISAWLLMLRGHFLKMPLPILFYHLTVKSVRAILESVLGKHIFTKVENSKSIQNNLTSKRD